jgi:hypothetical protein
MIRGFLLVVWGALLSSCAAVLATPGPAWISNAELEAARDGLLGEVHECQTAAGGRGGGLSGSLGIRVAVDRNGDVQDVRITKDMVQDASFAACVLERSAAWKAPFRSATPTPVSFDLTFALLGSPAPSEAELAIVRDDAMREVRACQSESFARRELPTGQLGVSCAFAPDGSVRSVRITQDTLGNGALSACVVQRLGGWRAPFRPSAAPPTAEFTFWFFATTSEQGLRVAGLQPR